MTIDRITDADLDAGCSLLFEPQPEKKDGLLWRFQGDADGVYGHLWYQCGHWTYCPPLTQDPEQRVLLTASRLHAIVAKLDQLNAAQEGAV